MAGGKLPPRQKMIGMMYLVLTALLAMNVSKEVLNSFVVINDGLETTNENFDKQNQRTYNEFEAAMGIDPVKTKPWFDKAKLVQTQANELVAHIDEIKRFVIGSTAKFPDPMAAPHDSLYELKNVDSKDNYDVPTQIMIGPDPAILKEGQYTAKELRGKLEGFRERLIQVFENPEKDKQVIETIKSGLSFEDVPLPGGGVESWESGNFYHLPCAAVITNLSKLQADVRNAEADVIKYLLTKIGAEDFKFDTLAAKVLANTNYVILGDTYRADVIVAAYSTTTSPQLYVGEIDSNTMEVPAPDTTLGKTSVKNGVASYTIVPKSEGQTVWGGIIKIQKPDGTFQGYPFESSFFAAKPALVVSPTAMNVFYRGLDNPVDISVPGVPTELLKPSMTNGSIKPAGGKKGSYIVRPGQGKESVISVSAEINGSNQNFGKMEFRCKNVPDPKASFGGVMGGGTLPKGKLMAVQGVLAKMENFEFDLNFTVVEFSISMNYKGNLVEKKAKSNRLTDEMKNLLKAAKKGSKVFIEGIKAKGPDGTVRNLGAISIKVL